MYSEIEDRVSKGGSYESLKKDYPLMTKSLYVKLGGRKRQPRFSRDSDMVKAIVGSSESLCLESGPPNHDFLIGSLFGDGHIEPITDNPYTRTCLYRTAHCWAQSGYVKAIYEILKPFSSAITPKAPTGGLQDWTTHFTTIASPFFNKYRDLFYTHQVEGCNNKKDVLQEKLIPMLNWRSLAYWIMDDGSHRGGKYCFRLSIGINDIYTDSRIESFVDGLSSKFGVKFLWEKGSGAYGIYILEESSRQVAKNVLPYIWPDFFYKFRCSPEECGEVYRGEGWFKEWELFKRGVEHPFLAENSIKDFQESTDPVYKERFKRALFSRTHVRGFPYPTLSEDGLRDSWVFLKGVGSRISDGSITCSPIANKFPSHFMPHRFHCYKKNSRSPYEVFLDRQKLMKTIETQLKSGDSIQDTNIRNALTTYASSGVGQFNAGIAKFLINEYCRGSWVLDPCSGWGNRLSGAVAAGKNYWGIDPSTKTYESLLRIKDWFLHNSVPSEVVIHKGVAEDRSYYRPGFFDLSITSPPYFDTEIYSEEGTQSCAKYYNLKGWISRFLRPFIENVWWGLREEGYFILNIADTKRVKIVGPAKEISSSLGFVLEETYALRGFRKPGMSFDYVEPVFIMRKVST